MIVGNEKKVRSISIIFFVIGIVIAIINGAKVTNGTEVIFPFFCGIGLAAFGLAFWQLTDRKLKKNDLEAKVSSGHNPFNYIKQAAVMSSTLLEKMKAGSLNNDEICSEIDKIGEQALAPFVEVRSTVLDMLGYGEGSELLISVAHGERLLNRVWSCVGDSYPEEGLKVLPEVVESFNAVLEDVSKKLS